MNTVIYFKDIDTFVEVKNGIYKVFHYKKDKSEIIGKAYTAYECARIIVNKALHCKIYKGYHDTDGDYVAFVEYETNDGLRHKTGGTSRQSFHHAYLHALMWACMYRNDIGVEY